MKNRIIIFIVSAILMFAVIGLIGSFLSNPLGFFGRIAFILIAGVILYFIVQRFSQASPEKKEQRAFNKAAKRSKKRLRDKDSGPKRQSSVSTMKKATKTKKKMPAHLTVIEGKKGKKKNRATF